MAHQPHDIPWQALVQHLQAFFREGDDAAKWVHSYDSQDTWSNFYLCSKPNQGKDLDHFVEAFARNIHEHTRTERSRYPETYKPPREDEIMLPDELVRKLGPLALYARQHSMVGNTLAGGGNGRDMLAGRDCVLVGDLGEPPCQHDNEQASCNCIIPLEYRKAASFLRPYQFNEDYEFLEVNGKSFFNLELVKAMLLHGELDPILRACSTEHIDLENWHSVSQISEADTDAGWDRIYQLALDMYLSLNICYCFPDLWDAKSGQGKKTQDYRNTYLFQHVLQRCTELGAASDVPSIPHRQFFGMIDDSYSYALPRISRGQFYSAGKAPWETFTAARHCAPDPFIIPPSSFHCAVGVLRQTGLPPELVDQVMKHFGRASEMRAEDPGNPLHPVNSEQLRRYLEYCWQLKIRCSAMAGELKMRLDWRIMVIERLAMLISGVKLDCEQLDDDSDGSSVYRYSFA